MILFLQALEMELKPVFVFLNPDNSSAVWHINKQNSMHSYFVCREVIHLSMGYCQTCICLATVYFSRWLNMLGDSICGSKPFLQPKSRETSLALIFWEWSTLETDLICHSGEHQFCSVQQGREEVVVDSLSSGRKHYVFSLFSLASVPDSKIWRRPVVILSFISGQKSEGMTLDFMTLEV